MTDPKPRLPVASAPAPTRPALHLIPATPTPPEAVFLPPVDALSSGLPWARRYRARLQLTDMSIILGAVGAALILRFGISDPRAPFGTIRADYLTISALIAGAWILALGIFHTRDSRVVGVGAAEYRQVMNASALTFGLLAIGFLILQIDIARGYFMLALPLGVVGLLVDRWLWRRWLLRQRRFGHYLARAIVVGNREDVEYVVGQIDEKSGAAYFVVGAALDEKKPSSVTVGGHCVPVVADFAHVAAAAAALGVDTVVVAGQPNGGSQFIRNLGWELESTTAELVLSSRLTDVAGPRIHFRPVEGLPLIHVEIPHFDGAKHALKRLVDVVSSGMALLLFAPLMLVIGILVKIDSPGPVLFRQERCGRGGRTFRIIKFRSMIASAEDDLAGLLDKNEASGVLFKLRNDPRITRVGRVLRKFSLDELPQLWNILVGEMSVVGPRPPLPQEVESYETHVHRRLYIKPGLTGMWQVNGRSNLSWEDSVRLDLYYVENWSLAGDMIIIWRTVKTVLRPEGAY
ncbi:sugar transferase [Leifsonia kafniensis]|uniref:Sugar transferase n=1 Tax=Leifsonia kafniensis TaxID=475957 RepID=A0ABP7KW46_9MICO